ncbi:MAG: hypothetical protein REI95_14725 [Oxalicibacterium faecigallinarum]|uniref:hypothetical protein n=1 Tax=Oxalicibacterium faecigallinarum TaxID=573741 RepID=UPI002806F2BF|nr:hypothetical protein [Oxalicibacterium faecigallinarum]MDQ7970884.1 hypothetical protein [Oxalicibacterium faecigallinarum]
MKSSQKTIVQTAAAAILTLALSACAVWQPATLQLGETEQQVISQLGAPTARIPSDDGDILEYNRNPWGQATHLAKFGPDRKLRSYEQVLTTQHFAKITLNSATKMDVLRTVGHPSETSYLPRQQLEVWSYHYRESGAWNSVMHIHFNQNGIVTLMQNTQDLRFENDGMFGFFGS